MPATTLDFMPGEIDLVDCFVAGAATCLGTVIGLAINSLFNYYHLSPHIRAHVLCAGLRARYVFLTFGMRKT
jgi:hypothetical protein